jgi:HSP20 family protein
VAFIATKYPGPEGASDEGDFAMAISRWDPFREALTLQNRMQSLLQNYAGEGAGREGDALTASSFVPPVDIYEDTEKIVLTLEAPGIAEDAFHLSVENNILSVRGERQWSGEQKEENYHRVERRYGSFHRSFTLPPTVNAEGVQASYDAGILRIELTKRPEARSRQIKVQIGKHGAASADSALQNAKQQAEQQAEQRAN